MPRKSKLTPEQELAELLARQQSLQEEIKRRKALVEKRAAEAREAKVRRIGAAVIEILGDLDEAELVAKLQALASTPAVAPTPVAEPAPAY